MRKLVHYKTTIAGCFLALLLSFGSGLAAQTDPIGFSIENASVTEKETFTVAVSVDSLLTGRDVFSYRFYITYSPSYFEFISMDSTGVVLSEWGNPVINSSNEGTLIFAGAGTSPLEGSGAMFYLKFRSTRSGNSNISFNSSESYLNEGNPTSSYNSGSISSAALSYPNISPDHQDMYIGDEIAMSVSGGVEPYVFTTADSSVLQVTDGNTVRAIGPGTSRVTVTDGNEETSTTSGLFDVRAIRMDMEEVSVWPNDTFYIPVKLEIAPGTTVFSGRFEIEFNSSMTALPGDILQGDYPVQIQSHPKSGLVTVSFASSSGISGSGLLCYLPFRAGSSGNRHARFNNIRFNETLHAWTTSSTYYMNVRSLPTLGLSPNSGSLMWGELLKFNVSNGTAPYVWSVSDTSVASIDIQGNLEAINGGEVRITATDDNGATATSGIFTVQDHQVSLYNTEGTLDTETRVPIISTSLPDGKLIYGYSAGFSFDDTYLEFVRAEGPPGGNGLAQASLDGNTIEVAGALSTGVSSGVIGLLVFNVKNALDIDASTTVSFDLFSANENSLYSILESGTVRRVEQTSYRPVAVAGLDFSLQEGNEGSLDGTSSFDLDGDPFSYHWSAPEGIILSDSTSPTPQFSAPYVEKDSVFTISLVVNDGTNDSDPDEVEVMVLQVNIPPTANAGPDENLVEGSTVNLDGSDSFDSDGDALSYNWKALDARIVLFNAASVNPSFILPQVSETTGYKFTLVVNDGALSSGKDTVTITAIQVNKKPVAYAGGDFSIDEEEEYTLHGSLSYDEDNDLLTYHWTAPPEVTLSSNTLPNPSFTAPSVVRDSVMEFSLVVNDGSKDSDPDIVRGLVINLDSLSRETYIDSVYLPVLDSFALDTAAALVTMFVPYGTNTRSLAPGFTLSQGASISPATESTHDFSMPFYYTVTAEDGVTSRMWKVEVYRPMRTVQRELDAGWNWLSLNVQPDDPSIDTVFSGISPSELDYIKSSAYSSVFYPNTGWFGNLVEFPRQGVIKFKKGNAEELSVTGLEINPAIIAFPMVMGWNDLPLLLRSDEAIGQTLDNSTLPPGDVIVKGRQGSALYVEGSGWSGELDTLRVLHGYRIHLTQAAITSYQVNSAKKNSAGIRKYLDEEPSRSREELLAEYSLEPQKFEYSATLIANVLSADGKSFVTDGDVLIARSGDKIRGVSQATWIESSESYLFVLTYYANSEDNQITFNIQTNHSENEFATDLMLPFEADAITGTALDPQLAVATDVVVATIQPDARKIEVYPNPARDRITVKSSAPVNALRLYDLAGTLLLQEKMEHEPATMTLQKLNPGIYTLEVETADQIVVRKIVKTSR